MAQKGRDVRTCAVCGRTVPESQAVLGEAIRPAIVEEIVRDHAGWSNDAWICRDDLRR